MKRWIHRQQVFFYIWKLGWKSKEGGKKDENQEKKTFFCLCAFIREEEMSLIKKAYFMLIFLNLKSFFRHFFFFFFCSSIQPQHAVLTLVRAKLQCSAMHSVFKKTSEQRRWNKSWKSWTKQSKLKNLMWKTSTRLTFYMAIIIKKKKKLHCQA